MPRTRLEQLVFTVLVGVVFSVIAITSLSFPARAQLFPLVVALTAVILVVIDLMLSFFQKQPVEGDGLIAQGIKVAPYLVWVLLLYLGIFLFGFVIASGLFLFVFLLREAKMNIFTALAATAIVVVFIFSLGNILSLEWPFGLISEWFGIEL